MATTVTITNMLTAWDAAMATYNTAHGAAGVGDMLGAGFDMNSTDSAGLWTVEGAAAPDLIPNSHVPVFWTDGTDTIGPLSYDDLSNANKVASVLDGYFGASFKFWRLATHVLTALSNAGGTVTDIGAGPWDDGDVMDFIAELEGRYDPTSEYGLELPGLMG